MITVEQIKQSLEYFPHTGLFSHKKTHRNVKCGDIAGTEVRLSRHTKKYIRVGVLGRCFSAHRLAFFYMTGNWPKGDIDHINQDSLDNRWSNLRDCSHAENGKNQKKYINNSTGITGITKRNSGKWRARIFVSGKSINLGTYVELHDAVFARKTATLKYGFHENHGQ